MLGACNSLEELGLQALTVTGTPVLTAGLVFVFPSGTKQYCEIGWYSVTLKCLICVTGLGQRFTGQPWRLNTGLSGHETSRKVTEWSLGGVMRTKDSQQGFLQFVCLEAFPTSEYLQLSHIQMSTALQARGDPNTHHETAAAESCPCETNAMLTQDEPTMPSADKGAEPPEHLLLLAAMQRRAGALESSWTTSFVLFSVLGIKP